MISCLGGFLALSLDFQVHSKVEKYVFYSTFVSKVPDMFHYLIKYRKYRLLEVEAPFKPWIILKFMWTPDISQERKHCYLHKAVKIYQFSLQVLY